MKKVSLIARYLLGLIFVVFSLNFWLHFIPMPEMDPDSPASKFMGAMYGSGFLTAVKVLELVGGILLLSGRYINLGLALLGPIVVNIVFYHVFLTRGDYPMAIVLGVLSLLVLAGQRDFRKALLAAR
jgi:uncharacterized membrane protein YphA (DoxX/SURF4 family)